MWCHVMLGGLLAIGAQAFAPAPIQWGDAAQRFVLVDTPRAFLNKRMAAPQRLTVGSPFGMMSHSALPSFTAQPDNTIHWSEIGWCVEASGTRSGDAIRVNHCNGGPNQKWDWFPWGQVQLQGTDHCLAVRDHQGGSDEASIELGSCGVGATALWRFGEPLPAQSPATLSFRNFVICFISIAAIGTLSLGAWLLRLQSKARGLSTAQHGVCLTEPMSMPRGSTASPESLPVKLETAIPAVMMIHAAPVSSTESKKAFLLALNPSAGGASSGPMMSAAGPDDTSAQGQPEQLVLSGSRNLRSADAVMFFTDKKLDKKQEQSVEEVTEKYGLEAGLFSIFKRNDKGSGDNDDKEGGEEGSMTKAGDLLKKYGGAYLLTSTSLAAVSFGLCYVAVDNGIDMGALLSNVGITVSDTSETAGTVGIAYAIHKAASPIRFPPTVALTPIVARNIFGKNDDESKD